MRNFVPCLRSRLLARAAVVALGAGALGACSSDTTRFGEDPFSNPFSTASAERRAPEPDYTSSVQAAPSSRVERAPLGAPPPAQARPMRGFENSGGYRQSSVDPRSTGALPPARSPEPRSGAVGWSSNGGTVVTLQRGESLHTLSQRYGVPATAIMQANNMRNANGLAPGQQIVIPSYSGQQVAAAPAPSPARVAAAPAPMTRPAPAPMRPAGPAQVANAAPNGEMKFVTGAQPKGAEPAAKPAPQQVAAAPVAKPAPAPVAEAKPADDNVKTAALKVDPAPAADSAPSFRWPVRGRVISAYGSKASGTTNDGINVAVPEGTDVKASDDGVVAYAGSELKGFGNLVLIRHSNGWVTAYAHNSALKVKRGDTVRRGQVIAKSGSTGNVSSPQLHFEVRKGATTVDPLQHLPNA
ncbi:M23 family metallopeptidase [Hansschlegelia beijingensis]|uniref:Murein DD-endopeptidase MepM/ murein hydrolase activator NlpD n=1 Tax=Hansschlegelia beijingensis TaxID=1133344 RepID=A0A7W6D6Y0_9HYPH|nr:M23 family metallopeptidase [Hansschlegelia beijingensis]MBB3974293.1 murein DD-endopeptidase MepM/ murein hydrolase activator NlpD [Hansschlegelia beijingensis]